MADEEDYIDRMFKPITGHLAGLSPNYGLREGQVKLARAIKETLTYSQILLGEAGTGSGKSYAYLIPAIQHALATNKPVLIVTANKALQEQLASKDLPLLRQAFEREGKSFSYQLIKGRSNYLCQREMAAFDAVQTMPGLNVDEHEQLNAVSAWASMTPTGDQSDAPDGVSQRAWNAVSVSGERCTRNACPHVKTCFAEKATHETERVHIVVANYDLFFSKLLHIQSGESVWLRFGAIIADEAHEMANIARRCFGTELGLSYMHQIANDFGKFVGDYSMSRDLRDKSGTFFDDVARYAVRSNSPRLNQKDFADPTELIDIVDDVLRASKGSCGACSNASACGTCTMRASIRSRCELVITQLRDAIGQSDDATAYWIDKPSDDNRVVGANVKLRAMPYRVGEHLNQRVFSRYPAIVCVSATMTSDGNFDFIREEMGLMSTPVKSSEVSLVRDWKFADYDLDDRTAHIQGVRIASPFNYAKQAKFVVPLGIPWPIPENDSLFNEAAVDAIRTLIQDCKGRLLALFTSKRRMMYVAEKLHGTIDYPLYVQGDAPNKQLAQLFRNTTNSVMLATKSFWVGLDVSGESLSCLVIDKLPLESFNDPLIDMMKTKHPEAFWNDFYFPRAAIELAQGAGRLIRSMEDRGVFVLLDSRIIGKSYGGMMRRSLPFVGFSKVLADAGKFLARAP